MGRLSLFTRAAALVVAAAFVSSAGACQRKAAPKQFPLHGQVLSVDAARQQLTIKHGDIVGYMPGMTMTFPVKTPALMQGRAVGEIIDATLEVQDYAGTITAVTHVGEEPLPAGSGEMPVLVDLLAEGDQVPDAAFIDQNDKRRSITDWRGTPTVITFAYTSCPVPNFCPLMDQNFATLQRAVAEDPVLAGHVQLVTVTVDPEHDTPAVLRAHMKLRRADPAVWTWLTGDKVTVERFGRRFGVAVAPGEPGVTHNLRTALVGADFRIAKFYTGNEWTPSVVLADLRALPR